MTREAAGGRFASGADLGVRVAVYGLYFLSGATALTFEILWMRQFVLVFGNSSYSVTVVLAAFMAGLGLGSLVFGKIADRREDRLYLFALLEGGIIIWALLIPALVAVLARVTPVIFASISSVALIGLIRFAFSFLVLLVPCVLMGGTLPVLSRFTAESRAVVGTRVSLLYGLNTLGAAAGCFATGFYLIETLGQSGANWAAVTINLVILGAVLLLRKVGGEGGAVGTARLGKTGRGTNAAEGALADKPPVPQEPPAPAELSAYTGRLLLIAAFISGFATMCAEVLWIRYLVFVVPNNQYSFTSILGVLLFGLALGSLIYRVLIARRERQVLWLAGIEMALGPVILLALLVGSAAAMGGGSGEAFGGAFGIGGFLRFKIGAVRLAALTIFLPTVLIGVVFPLICAVYTRSAATVGRSVGTVAAVNTLGSILGSVAPIAFVVAWLGIQRGLFAVAVLNSALGVLLVTGDPRGRRLLRTAAAAAAAVLVLLAASHIIPPDLTQAIFLSDPEHPRGSNDVTFYREGRTATVMVIQDKVTDLKEVYIGGVEQVPTTFMGHLFFKLFGSLGPLMHDDPKEVLVLCLGAGVTAGTITQQPGVERVECVDLVADMLEACRELSAINNNLVEDPKFRFVIEDARNYLLLGGRKFPVIVCDSTHPKSPDSWVLYTQEFYRSIKHRLADDGILAQWAPMHGLSLPEYKTIVRTFHSVFAHTSLWLVAGIDETGTPWGTTVMLATPGELSIDVAAMRQRLSAEVLQKDLESWGLAAPEGLLATFLCGEERLREWTDGLPANTDNLPYTQYHTGLTGTAECEWRSFVEVIESVWPYCTNTGDGDESGELKAALDRNLEARKLLLEGRVLEAFAAAPENSRLRRVKENLTRGQDYLRRVASLCEGDAAALSHVAFRMWNLLGYNELATAEDYASVAEVYRKVIAADPTDEKAYVNLGSILLSMGAVQEASEQLNRALSLDPDVVEAHVNLGVIFDQAGQYDDAVTHFRRAAELAPHDARIRTALGTTLARQGNIDEAITHFRRALETEPEDADIRNNLGNALAQRGELEAAVAQFEKAISLEPDEPRYHVSMGMAEAELGKLDAAIARFEKVLALDPYSAEAHVQIGLTMAQQERLEEAVGELRKALAISPADPAAREILAGLLIERRDFAGAIALLREGMRIAPGMQTAHTLARLLATCPEAALRNGEEAVTLAETVNRATGGSNPDALDTLAAAYAESSRFEEAIQTARDAREQALRQGRVDFAEQIATRLTIYEAGSAYHER